MAAISPPLSRQGFHIALICALTVEADYVESVFDQFWEDEGRDYGKAHGDFNSYTTGVISGHNVVLAHMPGMGKVHAANVASNLKMSFTNIKLAIIVGICGGAPRDSESGQEIILGDVIISQALIQYDLGRQYPETFARKDTVEDSLGRPSLENEIMTYIEQLRAQLPGAAYPGAAIDKLYESDYIHKHQNTSSSNICTLCKTGQECPGVHSANCDDTGCDDARLVVRRRLLGDNRVPGDVKPIVHIGRMGSGDTVMKSGQLRDELVNSDGIIGFEMEGAGVWEHFPSIIIKGVSDYADSHKNKSWQQYAAATASCCMKSFLNRAASKDPNVDHDLAVDINKTSLNDQRANVVWHVPFDRMQSLIGRSAVINDLQEKLFHSDRYRKVAVFGLGGVGKSRIAWEMADYARSTGQCSVLWVQATSMSTIERDYLEIGQKLHIPGISEEGSNIKYLVKQWLRSKSAGSWLMILDNADEESLWNSRVNQSSEGADMVDAIPSSSTGVVLITTRSRRIAVRLAGPDVVELQQMETTDAVDMMKTLTIGSSSKVDTENEEVKLLVQQLSCLPLAIVQAAAYININGLLIHEYLSLLNNTSEDVVIDFLSEDFEDETRYRQAQNCIASTWLISFKQIQETTPRAIDFLSYIVCLHEKNIPRSLLPEVSSEKKFTDIIGTLTGYSFINKQTHGRLNIATYDIHRLVRLATISWLKNKRMFDFWVKVAVKRVAEVFPLNVHENRDHWKFYMPHAFTLLAVSDKWESTARYRLLEKVAHCLRFDGSYARALEFLSSVLAWRIKTVGESGSMTYKAHYEVGEALSRQGDYTNSEFHLQKALQGFQQLNGDNSLQAVMCKSSLTNLYSKLGQYERAEQRGIQVVEARKIVSGPDHRATLNDMGQLATIYRRQGRYHEAEKLGTCLLELNTKIHGREHPGTLECMDNLAGVYTELGRNAEAEDLRRQTIKIGERILGKEHPNTLIFMYNLAMLYGDQERFESSESISTVVLEARQRILGPEHVQTLNAMQIMVRIYTWRERYAEAESMEKTVLKSFKNKLGDKHPRTLSAIRRLAQIHCRRGRWTDAENLVTKSLELSKKTLGPDHQSTICHMALLGAIYHGQHRHKAAYEIAVSAFKISERVRGRHLPLTLWRMEELAKATRQLGTLDRAIDLLQECVQQSEAQLGSENPLTTRRRKMLNSWRQ